MPRPRHPAVLAASAALLLAATALTLHQTGVPDRAAPADPTSAAPSAATPPTLPAARPGGATAARGGHATAAAFVPGRLLVGFAPGAPAAWRAQALRTVGGRVGGTTGGVTAVRLPAGGDVRRAAARLAAVPGVAFAEPDHYRVLDACEGCWQLGPDPGVNATPLHAAGRRGAGAVVAVLDDGVAAGLPELAGRVVARRACELACAPDTQAGGVHGSTVATLLAAGDDRTGTTGVAPQARVKSWRVASGGRIPTSAVVAALTEVAADPAVTVVNLSFSGAAASEAERRAVAAALAAGKTLVGSTGNDGGYQPQYPAAYPGVIAAGAVDAAGEVPPFSSYGKLDVVAPGVCVPVTAPPGLASSPGCAASTGGVARVSGTSFAAPLVAGVLALRGSGSPLRDRLALEGTAVKPPGDPAAAKLRGHGLVDAAALAASLAPDAPPLLVVEADEQLPRPATTLRVHLLTGPAATRPPSARPASATVTTGSGAAPARFEEVDAGIHRATLRTAPLPEGFHLLHASTPAPAHPTRPTVTPPEPIRPSSHPRSTRPPPSRSSVPSALGPDGLELADASVRHANAPLTGPSVPPASVAAPPAAGGPSEPATPPATRPPWSLAPGTATTTSAVAGMAAPAIRQPAASLPPSMTMATRPRAHPRALSITLPALVWPPSARATPAQQDARRAGVDHAGVRADAPLEGLRILPASGASPPSAVPLPEPATSPPSSLLPGTPTATRPSIGASAPPSSPPAASPPGAGRVLSTPVSAAPRPGGLEVGGAGAAEGHSLPFATVANPPSTVGRAGRRMRDGGHHVLAPPHTTMPAPSWSTHPPEPEGSPAPAPGRPRAGVPAPATTSPPSTSVPPTSGPGGPGRGAKPTGPPTTLRASVAVRVLGADDQAPGVPLLRGDTPWTRTGHVQGGGSGAVVDHDLDDVHAVRLAAGDTVTVALRAADPAIGLALFAPGTTDVFGQLGNVVADGVPDGHDRVALTYTATAGGTYLVDVYAPGAESGRPGAGAYTLTTTVTRPGVLSVDVPACGPDGDGRREACRWTVHDPAASQVRSLVTTLDGTLVHRATGPGPVTWDGTDRGGIAQPDSAYQLYVVVEGAGGVAGRTLVLAERLTLRRAPPAGRRPTLRRG